MATECGGGDHFNGSKRDSVTQVRIVCRAFITTAGAVGDQENNEQLHPKFSLQQEF
jgi:hypothetical protein